MLLSKEIKLTSQQWCDYVFDSKNKEYGAYQMRRTSSKRHISAFLIVAAFATVAVAVPAAIQKVRAENPQWVHDRGVMNLTTIPDEPEKPKEIPLDVPPPPPLHVATMIFVVPTMVSSDEIEEDKILTSQDVLKDSKVAIGLENSKGDEGVFLHPDDVIERPIFDRPVPKIDDKIEIVPAHAPEYPGGENELYSFVGQNLRYPEIAKMNEIQGTATIRFVVEKDGSVSGITLLRGFDNACNKEAVRVIELMAKQKWVPGRDEKGNAVRAYFSIPIRFKINER